MVITAIIHTLAPAAPPSRVEGVGALRGFLITAEAKPDIPGLYWFPMAFQVEIISETEPDNTGGKLPPRPRNRPRLKTHWWTETATESQNYQVDETTAHRT